MRKVFMDHAAGTGMGERESRLTRHLMGRMLELREDGAHILGPQNPFALRGGVVSVDFTTMDNAELALLLEREYGVVTRRPACASQNAVCFSPCPSVTFEDVDYVQGAILQILSRNR